MPAAMRRNPAVEEIVRTNPLRPARGSLPGRPPRSPARSASCSTSSCSGARGHHRRHARLPGHPHGKPAGPSPTRLSRASRLRDKRIPASASLEVLSRSTSPRGRRTRPRCAWPRSCGAPSRHSTTVDFIGIEHESSGAPSAMDAIRFVFSISAPVPNMAAARSSCRTRDRQGLAVARSQPRETVSEALDRQHCRDRHGNRSGIGLDLCLIEQGRLKLGTDLLPSSSTAPTISIQDAENLEAAYRCFEQLVSAETKFAAGLLPKWAALQLAAAGDGYRYRPPQARRKRWLWPYRPCRWAPPAPARTALTAS